MTKTWWGLLLVAGTLAGCGVAGGPLTSSSGTTSGAKASVVPSYRVFQGFRRSDITADGFLQDLSGKFLASGPCSLARQGMTAYLAALSPKSAPASLPVTFAMMACESEASYASLGASEEGKRFLAVQWSLFDPSRSTSCQTQRLEATGGQLVADNAYDLVGQRVDWQEGFTTIHIGLRPTQVTPAAFLSGATALFLQAKPTFASRGLDGFVTLASEDYVVSFTHWKDFWSYTGAMASRDGRSYMAEREKRLNDLMFVNTIDFTGQAKPGDAINVRFTRKPAL